MMRDVPPDGILVAMRHLWEGIVRRWLRFRNFVVDCYLFLRALWTGDWGDWGDREP